MMVNYQVYHAERVQTAGLKREGVYEKQGTKRGDFLILSQLLY